MADFTTWTAVLTAMKNAYASGDFLTQEIRKDGMTLIYKNSTEFFSAMKKVEDLVEREAGSAYARTYAKQGLL